MPFEESRFFKKGVAARIAYESRVPEVKTKPIEKRPAREPKPKKLTKFESLFRSDMPLDTINDLEKHVLILALERRYSSRDIVEIIKRKGVSFDQFIVPGKNQSRPEMVRVLVTDSLNKVLPYVTEFKQAMILVERYREFLRKI